MKVIRVYQKECTGCGIYKNEMDALRNYAARNDSTIQTIRTPLNPSLYEEAKRYNTPQPFAVIDDKAYPLGELPSHTDNLKEKFESLNARVNKKLTVQKPTKGESK